ncbi:FeS cluster assembly scaffold IscU [Melanogaster broomeanus]|nr:FeS cluster assembly scaffold IscU [Melanogaster broomeanus]
MFRSALSRSVFSAVVAPKASRTGISPVIARGYHEKVISHYESPRNVGSLPKNDIDVGTGLVGAPACGDVMKLQIRVDENGIISDVKFKTFGCGSAIASSSYMTERVKGLSLDEAGKIKNTEIAKELCLPPVKLHCSMLAEDAIRSAIRDYRTKRNKLSDPLQAGFIDVTQSAVTGQTLATAHPGQSHSS